jgi:HlyD family secretion protein
MGGLTVKLRRVLVVLLSVAVVGAGALWFYSSYKATAAVAEKDIVTAQRVDFPVLISATGILEASQSVSIGPPQIPNEFRFRLARMVDEGTKVEEGDFLLEFDTSDIARRLREETANLQRVQEEYQKKRSDYDIQLREQKLNVEQARADYEKLENKLSQQVGLESELTVAETRIRGEAAKKKLEFLQQKLEHFTKSVQLDLQISRSNESHYRARMDNLMEAMDSLTVRAPVPGVVIYKRDWNNEPRQIGSYVFALDAVLEIPDLSTVRAKLYVDEVDAGKVKPGQEALITVDALQGRSFSGKVDTVSAILKQATFDRPQKVAETFVKIEASQLRQLRPGMSVKAQIQVDRYPQTIAIPLTSIQERSGRSFVQAWNSKTQSWEWREIRLRMNDGLTAVIESGLEANERILAKPGA